MGRQDTCGELTSIFKETMGVRYDSSGETLPITGRQKENKGGVGVTITET